MNKKRIAIIGGGFTGLAAATVLSQKEHGLEVHLFEKKSSLGGLAGGFKEPGWNTSLEYYYHHWFESDVVLKKFAKIWGSPQKIFFKELLTVMETESGEFVRLDSGSALLKYPTLGFFTKVRMAFALAYLKLTSNWKGLEHFTAEEWCVKWMGKKGFGEIWQPLLMGKFGRKFASVVNMAWLWSRIKVRSKKLGSYQGGFQALIQDAHAYLEKQGVIIHLNCQDLKAEAAENKENGYWVRTASQDFGNFASVSVASAPQTLKAIAGGLVAQSYVDHVLARPAIGVRVIVLSLKEALNQERPIYWYSLRRTKEHPFLALVEHTHFVDAKDFGNEHIIYLATYMGLDEAEWNLPDEKVLEQAFKTCQKINAKFTPAQVRKQWIFREQYAQPIMAPDASKDLPPIAVPGLSNFFFACMGQVYPWDRGTNFALELGETLADKVLADL